MLPPTNPSLYQPCPLEHLHVFGHPVKRDGEVIGQTTDVLLAGGEHRENGATRRIGDRAVDLVQKLGASHGLVFNQMVE